MKSYARTVSKTSVRVAAPDLAFPRAATEIGSRGRGWPGTRSEARSFLAILLLWGVEQPENRQLCRRVIIAGKPVKIAGERRRRQTAGAPDSYCPGSGGMLRLCTTGTGTAPPPSGEESEQFVLVMLKPIVFPVSRALAISEACMA